MKHFLFSALCILLFFSAAAQGTEPYCSVFTTDDGGNDKLWRVKIATPAVYESITDALDAHALFPGYHKGPVSISRNGEWFIFRSTRFDGESAANGEAITIAKTDMSVIETPKNPNPSWYYGEGMLQVSDDGQTILYVDAGTSHSRDVFKVEKVTATSWGTPVNLTGTSPYDYNTYPRFSYDATNRIVFNASNDPYIASNLGLTDLSGNVSMLIAATDISGCDLVNSGNLLADGSLYFEGETDAERIWVKNSSGTISALNTTMTNDNSPVFAGSKIVSLQLPNSLHHLQMSSLSCLSFCCSPLLMLFV